MKINIATTILILSSMVLVSCRKTKKISYFEGSSSDSSYSDYSDLFSSYDEDSESKDRSMSDHSYYYDKKHNKKKYPSGSKGTMLAMFLPSTAEKTLYGQMIGSQLSAIFPLGKLVFGASGMTRNELLAVLGLRSESDVSKYFKKLLYDLESLKGVYLELASRIYLSDKHRVNKNFKAKVDEVFRSSCEVVNMKNPSEVAAKINWWVDEKTHGRIKDLISPSSIDPASSLIIVNAIYFSGKWKVPFKYDSKEVFHGFTGSRSISMMSVSSSYNHGISKKLSAQIIEIPYQGSEASMIIILPDKKDGLPSVIAHIKEASGNIQKLVKMQKKEVELTIPKFKIETVLDLGSIYRMIGVRQAFSSQSKLTGIAEKSRDKVMLSSAIQKAVIEVNEIGTKAAAASGKRELRLDMLEVGLPRNIQAVD